MNQQWPTEEAERHAAQDRAQGGHREVPATSDGVPDNNPPPPHDLIDKTEEREVMLEELAEQRQAIRESGMALPDADRTIGIPVEEELQQMKGESSS